MALRAIVFLASSLMLRSIVEAAPGSETGTETGTYSDGWEGLSNGFQVMYSAYQQCDNSEDLVSCLKLRALRSADRALRQDRVSLFGGLSFVKEPARGGRGIPEPQPVDEVLPETGEGRAQTIDNLLFDRLDRFFQTHSLQMEGARLLGEPGDEPAANPEEGRGRGKGLKKHGGLLLMGLIMKSGLMALAWKGVALVAAKALMIAKIALILAVIVALKKSHHGDEKSISIGHESGGEYKRRSIIAEAARRRQAQILAYNAHVHHHPISRRPSGPVQVVAAGSEEVPYYHYPPAEEYQQQLHDEYIQQQQEQEQQQLLQEQMAQEQMAQDQSYAYQP